MDERRGYLRKATILVADDDDSVRSLVGESLRRVGYHVLEAATGEEAMTMADLAPDLLLADLVMPPDGGLDLAERMRSRIPSLAVLHMSGYAPRTDFNDDASAVLLSKPFSIESLVEHVDSLLLTRPATS